MRSLRALGARFQCLRERSARECSRRLTSVPIQKKGEKWKLVIFLRSINFPFWLLGISLKAVLHLYIYLYKHMTHESEVDWYSIKMCTSLLCLNQLEYIFAPSVFFLSCFKDCLFLVCSFHPRLQKVCKSLLNFYSVAKNNLRSRKRNEQLSKYTHGKRFDTQTRI